MEWHIKAFEELSQKDLYKILRKRNEVFIIEQNCIYQDCDEKNYGARETSEKRYEKIKHSF